MKQLGDPFRPDRVKVESGRPIQSSPGSEIARPLSTEGYAALHAPTAPLGRHQVTEEAQFLSSSRTSLPAAGELEHAGNRKALPDERRPDSDVGRPRTAILLFGTLPFFVILAATIGLASGLRGVKLGILSLALATTAIALAPLILDQARRPSQRHIFLSLFSILFIIYYVTPAFFLYLPAQGAIDASSMTGTALLPHDVVTGQLIALIGLLSLFIGYAIPVGRFAALYLPRPRIDWLPPVIVATASGLILLGWAIRIAGTLGIIPEALNTGVFTLLSYHSYLGNALLTFAVLRNRSRIALILLAANLFLGTFYGFASGRKIDMLAPATVVILTSTILRGRFRVRWLLLGAVALMLVYPLSEFMRNEMSSKENTIELFLNPISTLQRAGEFASSVSLGGLLLEGASASAQRVDGLGVVSVITRDTPTIAPFLYGKTLGFFFIAFIPRALWADKPSISIGAYVTQAYGSAFYNPEVVSSTAPTNIGDFYMNFGVWGVLFGMSLLGVILRMAYEVLFRNKTAAAFSVQILLVFFIILRFENGVAAGWADAIFTMVPIAMVHLFIVLFLPTTRLPGVARAADEPRP